MDHATAALLCFVVMLGLMVLGLPIAYALGVSSVIFGTLAWGVFSLDKLGWTTFQLLYSMIWSPLPLFIFMACLITQTKIGEDLYWSARNWFGRIPGGLIVGSIWGEAALAATLGTSAACIMAVGKVAEPEFKRYGYNKALAFGGLVCGGVLGPLIPPSSTMIIYSVLSGGVSLGHLFMAGIMPGILLAAMLSAVPIVLCLRNPQLGPPVKGITWLQRFASLKRIWPVILVMISIIGTIYLGIATPTEAAAVGCVVVLVIAVAFFGLRLQGVYQAMREAAIINAMILFIFVGASFFSYVVGSSGLAKNMAMFIASSGLSRWWVVISIMVFLLILGCFIDGMTIMMLTIPLFVPVMRQLGFNLVWFGILYVVNMQIALITPPMGIDLFLTRSAFNIPVNELLHGLWPYLIVLIIFLAVLVTYPPLSTWLPSMMLGR
jgi:tripartite ATP-independent transporter DctM subunit